MNLRVLIPVLILCLPVAWYAGYLVGKSVYTEQEVRNQQGDSISATGSPAQEYKNELEVQTQGISAQASNQAYREDSESDVTPSDDDVTADTSERSLPANDRETTGKMLAMRPDKEHSDLRNNFAETFSPEDEDWQAKTQFTDFLQLHEHADLITLHKILCSTDRCQLIGQFDAQHKQWETVIDDMKKQDWWTYTGTSSSSSTRDGVTYFNLFVDKPAEQP